MQCSLQAENLTKKRKALMGSEVFTSIKEGNAMTSRTTNCIAFHFNIYKEQKAKGLREYEEHAF